jgi:hypothetical protein
MVHIHGAHYVEIVVVIAQLRPRVGFSVALIKGVIESKHVANFVSQPGNGVILGIWASGSGKDEGARPAAVSGMNIEYRGDTRPVG